MISKNPTSTKINYYLCVPVRSRIPAAQTVSTGFPTSDEVLVLAMQPMPEVKLYSLKYACLMKKAML